MAKPKVIFFDLGNVMLKLRTQHFAERVAALCVPVATPAGILSALSDPSSAHHLYERGQIDGPAFHQALQERFGFSASYAAWLPIWNALGELNRPMEALMARLKGQARFFALSNTNAEHLAFMKMNFRFMAAFEGIVASHEVKLRKPEAAIYKKALEMAGVKAEEAFYIDDVAEYTQAAEALGIQVFNYTFNDEELRTRLLELGFELGTLEGKSGMAC